MIRTITKEFTWESAHILHDNNLSPEENETVFGACNRLHGHTYTLYVTISKPNNSLENGMIMNFKDLKKIVNSLIVDRFDHHYINDDELLKDKLTTCENQVALIWALLDDILLDQGIVLEELKLYETKTSFCTLKREVTNENM